MKLSIIILNYNSGALLAECLDSLFASGLPFRHEVIVPDNASTDASLDSAVQKWGPRLQTIPTGANGGFAWGNNIGIRASRGEYVCLLNPDTVIRPGAFPKLVALMDAHPRAGFAGPKVLNQDGSFQLSARRSIPTPFDAMARALLLSKLFPRSPRLARYNLTYLDPGLTQKVDACTGCCMMARRAMLDQIGLLDEGYFIYCEDVDWFLRAKEAGWEVWYVAEAVIEHHNAYSERFRRADAVRDFHRSMVRFYRKHYARRYPFLVNWAVYAAVWARMGLVMGCKALKGWK
jgi:hypothetical protein